MKIFDGYLLCTDLDDTLLTTDKKISGANENAIKYFMSEGGKFAYATGRVPDGLAHYINQLTPNVPIICYNGAGIYDIESKKYLMRDMLAPGAADVLDYIHESFDFAGIEVVTENTIYASVINNRVREHINFERLEFKEEDYHKIPEPWIKALFMQETDEIEYVKQAIAETDFSEKYRFVQSSPYYYEVLPHGSSKGTAAVRLCDIAGIDRNKLIGVGDNENDKELIAMSGIGIAVENASDDVKKCADIIAPHHNSDAMVWIVEELERRIKK